MSEIIVYHGSPNKFEEFDYSRIRTNGSTEGVGFYFTDNKRIAEGYGNEGYLYTVKLNGKKALSDNEKTLTKDEVRRFVEEFQKYDDYLSNYGDVEYEGYERVLKMAVDSLYEWGDTDTEIMASVYTASGEDERVITLFYEILGYDHVVSKPEWGGEQTLYIALTNDIIEIKEITEKGDGIK